MDDLGVPPFQETTIWFLFFDPLGGWYTSKHLSGRLFLSSVTQATTRFFAPSYTISRFCFYHNLGSKIQGNSRSSPILQEHPRVQRCRNSHGVSPSPSPSERFGESQKEQRALRGVTCTRAWRDARKVWKNGELGQCLEGLEVMLFMLVKQEHANHMLMVYSLYLYHPYMVEFGACWS